MRSCYRHKFPRPAETRRDREKTCHFNPEMTATT